MAAYAALTSLMQILDQLERHPFPPISLDKQQVESLTEIVTFLQEFLEGYNSPFADSDEADPLEMRIADAAYAAEDVIESYIVDNIHVAAAATHDDEVISSSGEEPNSKKEINWSWSRFFNCFRGNNKEVASHEDASSGPGEAINSGEEISCVNLYQDVWNVIEEMDLVKKEAMEMMREKTAVKAHHQLQRNILRSSSFTGKNSIMMVGFDDVLLQLLDKLTRGPSTRQVIPITGMGGIGKTTLARNIFQNALIKEYFDICAWVTISQQYNIKDILSQILFQASGKLSEKSGGELGDELHEYLLGDELHKYLFGRRYLIIMDDIWSIEVWEKMSLFFADCNNGSRIIVTTRQSFLTSQLTDPNNGLDMEFLDEDNSWNLFSKTVFGEEIFPSQLEKIGKNIVAKCRGLPLSIIVIGGHLAKCPHTYGHWANIEYKLNSIVNSENYEYCLKVLKLSYNHLPAHLKPSFLYMGIFEEDREICVSTLIKLWVSEGFIKPENGKSLETIGKEFLKDLIDRNLILVHRLGSTGNIKYCTVHDLLRDLCLKEAKKERFYDGIWTYSPRGTQNHNQRRIVHSRAFSRVIYALKSMTSHVRSFTSQSHDLYDSVGILRNFRLLRILNAVERETYRLKNVIDELVNSRYIAITDLGEHINLPSSVNFLWNLHTLRIDSKFEVIIAPVEIWKMSQLRHVEQHGGILGGGMYLPDPSSGSSVMLENLQTLKGIVNLKCGEDVVKRIPNIKRLSMVYKQHRHLGIHDACVSNLEYLHKLESLTIMVYGLDDDILHNIIFPQSLKKLSLSLDSYMYSVVGWEEMLEKIGGGSLSLLQKLKLEYGYFKTGKWETVEGQFPSLKFLELCYCKGLKYWTTDSSHLPCLEHLYLGNLYELEEIPLEIGEIPTLQSIQLSYCSESAVKSAKKIVEEQEELQGGEQQLSFHVRVLTWRSSKEALQSLASPNFEIKPGPRSSVIQCFIKRNRGMQTYHLYLNVGQDNEEGKFLLAARRCRRPTYTDYIISLNSDDVSKGSSNYIGKLRRSNFLGTKFTIYDAQPPNGVCKVTRSRSTRFVGTRQVSPRVPDGNYPVAHISYELNVLGSRGPRRMHCIMDAIPASAVEPGGGAPIQTELLPANLDSFPLLPLFRLKSTRTDSFHSVTWATDNDERLVLKNKSPRWHEPLQCWCLNFNGRVTVASVKNFQLVAGGGQEQENVILQFGKVGHDTFTMDYQYPLSAFQAFAICLSSFDTKIACE